ncbi:unnamed protein product [Prunus brigantina]
MRGEVIGHDAELLQEQFLAEQEKNESFDFKMEVDLEGRMGNVFRLDARSRRAYRFFFGDVVVFDMTFNTNRCGMVFVPLLGVNNHRQTVLFCCAFLTSETTDSFVWLLEEFKKGMPDKNILKRWLQSVKSDVIYDKNHKEVNDCIDGLLLVKRLKVHKVASDLIDSALLCDEGFELLEKSFDDSKKNPMEISSSSDTKLGGPVAENLQPTQSTQNNEPTMEALVNIR